MNSLVKAALFVMSPSEGEAVVAAQIEIEEGWHIYWENPGQSGYPSELTGACVREMVYAPPHMFTMPGEIINYGYEGSVWLFAKGDCKEGDSVTLSWLSCREDTCVPGDFSAPLQKIPSDLERDVQAQWNSTLRTEAITHSGNGWFVAFKAPAAAEIEYFLTSGLEAQSPELSFTKTMFKKKWQISSSGALSQGEKVVVRITKRGKEKVLLYTVQE